MTPDDPEPTPHYSAEDVRQGEIILRRRWQRIVFIAGLVSIILIAIAVRLAYR